jgi:hypothetical protein
MTTLSPIAIAAARAGRNYRRWGRLPTLQFCRSRGVPVALLTLARQLAHAERNSIGKD